MIESSGAARPGPSSRAKTGWSEESGVIESSGAARPGPSSRAKTGWSSERGVLRGAVGPGSSLPYGGSAG